MQRYTVSLSLETALHVSGGISTHHLEHTQLYTYLRHLALLCQMLYIQLCVLLMMGGDTT